ncbi:MAG: hypothetical protein Q4D13_07885 [Erysipelotrichaceae bacterium]|nr:hypothetical protein [Erysipelotrichaceae bacterium]
MKNTNALLKKLIAIIFAVVLFTQIIPVANTLYAEENETQETVDNGVSDTEEENTDDEEETVEEVDNTEEVDNIEEEDNTEELNNTEEESESELGQGTLSLQSLNEPAPAKKGLTQEEHKAQHIMLENTFINLQQGDTRILHLPEHCYIAYEGDLQAPTEGLVITDLGNNTYSVYVPVTNTGTYSYPVLDIMCDCGAEPENEHCLYLAAAPNLYTIHYAFEGDVPQYVSVPGSVRAKGSTSALAGVMVAERNYGLVEGYQVAEGDYTYTFSGFKAPEAYTSGGDMFEGDTQKIIAAADRSNNQIIIPDCTLIGTWTKEEAKTPKKDMVTYQIIRRTYDVNGDLIATERLYDVEDEGVIYLENDIPNGHISAIPLFEMDKTQFQFTDYGHYLDEENYEYLTTSLVYTLVDGTEKTVEGISQGEIPGMAHYNYYDWTPLYDAESFTVYFDWKEKEKVAPPVVVTPTENTRYIYETQYFVDGSFIGNTSDYNVPAGYTMSSFVWSGDTYTEESRVTDANGNVTITIRVVSRYDASLTPIIVPVTPSPVTPEPVAEETTPETIVEATPLAEMIIEDAAPLASLGAWALVNLICTIIAAVSAIILLISRNKKSEDEEAEYDENTVPADKEKETIYTRVSQWKVAGILVAVMAVIEFFMTEDMTLPMVMVDRWTLIMVMFALTSVWSLIYGRKWYENPEDKEEVNA